MIIKVKKENEILELNNLQTNLKNQIDENKSDYEKIIDEATEKIEDFLKKTNINKPLQ